MDMPFINSKVSIVMTVSQRMSVKEKLGRAIAIIPGKSEEWLMVEFADRCDLYFHGKQTQPSAFVEVKVFGAIPEGCLDELTGEICRIYEQDLQIPKDYVYVKYEEVDKWGWNGINF